MLKGVCASTRKVTWKGLTVSLPPGCELTGSCDFAEDLLILRSPVEVGSLSCNLQGFLISQVVSQVSEPSMGKWVITHRSGIVTLLETGQGPSCKYATPVKIYLAWAVWASETNLLAKPHHSSTFWSKMGDWIRVSGVWKGPDFSPQGMFVWDGSD